MDCQTGWKYAGPISTARPAYHMQTLDNPNYDARRQPKRSRPDPTPPRFIWTLVPNEINATWVPLDRIDRDIMPRPLKRFCLPTGDIWKPVELPNYQCVFDIVGFWLLNTCTWFDAKLYDNNDNYISRYIPIGMLWNHMTPSIFNVATELWFSTYHIKAFQNTWAGNISVAAYSKTLYLKNVYRLDIQAAFLRRCGDFCIGQNFYSVEDSFDYDWDFLGEHFPEAEYEFDKRIGVEDLDTDDGSQDLADDVVPFLVMPPKCNEEDAFDIHCDNSMNTIQHLLNCEAMELTLEEMQTKFPMFFPD